MKRKIISTLLAIVGISIIGFAILSFLGLFQEQDAGILIESDPVAKVYIDGIEVGITPYDINRSPGEVTIKIKPEQNSELVLDDYETKVNLISGIRTIIKREFKPKNDDSSGATVSFEKVGGEDSFVTAVSIPDNAQVFIDNKAYGYTPLRIRIPAGDHNLLIKADNYLEKQLLIRVYKGFKLTASVKLAKVQKPISTEEPVLVEENKKIRMRSSYAIRIDENKVGFLRVRSGANIGFPEVAQVKPGEEYEVIEEGENGKWYKIDLGWVSAEFVTKI